MDHPFYIEQQPYQGQSVLVTGGAGFIGRHLLDALLTAQASVTVVDKLSGSCRQTNKAFLNQVQFVEGDVADLACMTQVVRQTQPTVVFHLAANASVPNSIADPITAAGVGEAYNVSSGESVTITALAQRLLVLLGLAGQTELTYTGQSWAGDAQRWEVAIDKLKALGFQPAVSLDAGLQRTMAWFEDNYGAIIP